MDDPLIHQTGPLRPRHPHDFDEMYQETPPWDIGRPQPAFLALADRPTLHGSVLDVGCGTGEHALMAAERGFDVTGVDLAPRALEQARAKAAERGLEIDFRQWNALELPGLGRTFDTVLDCGLFHVFDDDDRPRFLASLAAAVDPGGRYFMLCFSDAQSGDWGPRRISESELRSCFAGAWTIDSLEPTTIDVTLSPEGAKAWLASMTRT